MTMYQSAKFDTLSILRFLGFSIVSKSTEVTSQNCPSTLV